MSRILFVCSANLQRSPTAADYFAGRFPDHDFDSAGTNRKICFQKGTQPVTTELLDWADVILVMETRHRKAILAGWVSAYGGKIRVLHIPDRYGYYDPALLELLDDGLINA